MRARLSLGAVISVGTAGILLLMTPFPAAAHHAFAADNRSGDRRHGGATRGSTVTMVTKKRAWGLAGALHGAGAWSWCDTQRLRPT